MEPPPDETLCSGRRVVQVNRLSRRLHRVAWNLNRCLLNYLLNYWLLNYCIKFTVQTNADEVISTR